VTRFRLLVENAPDAIVVLDLESGMFSDCNENALRLFRLTREELMRCGPGELSPPFQPDGRHSALAAREWADRATGATPYFGWTHRNSQGEEIPCEVHVVRLPSPAHKLIRGSILNITERKHAQVEREQLEQRLRQAEKMEAVGRLAAGIAHDFNNVLAGVFAYGEMLFEETPEHSPLKRYAKNVLTGATRGRALVEQILAYSRSQLGKRAPIDIGPVVAETIELLRGAQRLHEFGRPLLLAVSRKDFIGALTGRPPSERGAGTLAALAHGMDIGAQIFRVHDVAAAADFVTVLEALRGAEEIAPGLALPDELRWERPDQQLQ